jgi:hypothetical protein
MRDLLRVMFLAAVILGMVSQTASAAKDVPFVAKTETIKATISGVDVEKKLVILKSSDGTFYNFQVSKNTAIRIGQTKAKFEDLTNQTGKEATITFRMLRTGNAAQKIEIP